MSVFENKESSLRFIIALTQHRILGYVLLPFLISETKHGAFYVIESAVIKQYVDDEPWNYTPAQRELVKLTDKYSDENLAKRFSKEKSITTFYNNIETKYFNEHVFPYIDTQIVACIDIIKKHNIGLYYKPVKYNNIYDEDKIEIEQKPAEAVFHFTSENDGFNYRLQIKQNDRVLKIVNRSPVVLTNSPCRLVMHNRLYWFERLTAKRIFPFLKKESISVPAAVKEKYLKTFVHGIISDNDVKGDAFDIKNVESEKKAIILIEQDMNLEPIMVLVFQYGSKQFKAGRPEGVKVELINEKNRFVFYKHTRDFKWEKSIVTILADFGFELVGDMLQFALGSDNYSPDDNYRIIRWVNENGHNLEKHGICVEQNMPQKYYTGTIQLIIESRYENDWFDVYAMVHIDKFEIPFIYFKKNILEGRREYILPNGNIAILPAEWFNNYSNLIKFRKGVILP